MNNRQSLWILSSLMTIILCGIGVLLMLDFDTTIRRMVNEEVSMKASNSDDPGAETDRDRHDATPPPEVRPKSRRPKEIEISPAVLEEKAEEKSSSQETINGLRQQTTKILPRVALANPEKTQNRY